MTQRGLLGLTAAALVLCGLQRLAICREKQPASGDVVISRQALVEMALERNATLQGAEADIDRAQAAYDEVDAVFWYPHLELEGAFGGPVQQARGNAISVTPESRRDRFTLDGAGFLVRGEMKLLYPLFTFGRISAARDGLAALTQAASAQKRMKEADVRLQVETAVEAVLFARQMKRVLGAAKQRVTAALTFVQDEIASDSDEFSETDRDKLTYVAGEIANRHHQILQLRDEALAALMAVTAWDRDEPPKVGNEPFVVPVAVTSLVAPPVKEVVGRQPEVAAADHVARGRDRLAVESRRAFYPSFLIVGGARAAYSNVADRQMSPFAQDDYNYREAGLALAVKVDLDVAVKQAKVRRVEAQAKKAKHDSRAVRQGLTAKFRATTAGLFQSHKRAEALEEATKAANRWVIAESLDLSAGVGRTSDLVDALVAHYKVKFEHLGAIFATRRAYVEYLRFCPEGHGGVVGPSPPPVDSSHQPLNGLAKGRVVLAFNGSAPAWMFAGMTKTTPKELLQENVDRVHRALKAGDEKRLSRLAASLIDFDRFAHATLAKVWASLSDAQRQEFTRLFSAIIQNNYVGRIRQAGKFTVTITGDESEGGNVWIKSKAVAENGSLETDYLFTQLGGEWRVVDIRVEGVTLSKRYSHSFGRVIRREGFDGLLRRLKKTSSKGRGGPN